MPGRVYTIIADRALDQQGYITTRDAIELGVDPHRLVEMAHRGVVQRVGHGVYRLPVTVPTGHEQLIEALLWPRAGQNGRAADTPAGENLAAGVPPAVLSHETALDLHELGDFNPARIHITVPAEYRINPRRRVPGMYELHRRDLDKEDVTLVEGMAVVTPYRALLDGIEEPLRGDLLRQAFDTARRRGQLNPTQVRDLQQRLQKARPGR